MAKMEKETLIIEGKPVTVTGEPCEVNFERTKKQVILLDFPNAPCLIIYLKNDNVQAVVEIKRDSKGYNHLEHNKLVNIDSFDVEVK